MLLNNFISILVVLVYTCVSVIGLSLLKQAQDVLSWRFFFGALFYGAGFLIWVLVILRLTPFSIGFPIAAGALILGTQLAGYLVFRESITFLHGLGVMFIVIGITFVSWEVVK
jgi:multidrug transporter EmrE-like cation transporter